MTDRELIRAFRECDSYRVCAECPLNGKTECPVAEFAHEKLVDRLEALLAECAEMDIQIQKEICKRVDVERENKHLREVTKMVPRWRTGSEPPQKYRDEYGELKCFLVFDEYCTEPYRAVYDGKNWGDGWDSVNVTYWCELPERPALRGWSE